MYTLSRPFVGAPLLARKSTYPNDDFLLRHLEVLYSDFERSTPVKLLEAEQDRSGELWITNLDPEVLLCHGASLFGDMCALFVGLHTHKPTQLCGVGKTVG